MTKTLYPVICDPLNDFVKYALVLHYFAADLQSSPTTTLPLTIDYWILPHKMGFGDVDFAFHGLSQGSPTTYFGDDSDEPSSNESTHSAKNVQQSKQQTDNFASNTDIDDLLQFSITLFLYPSFDKTLYLTGT